MIHYLKRLILPVVTGVLLLFSACTNLTTPASDLNPINPDPSGGTDRGKIDIGYNVYVNFENEIRVFTTDDPTDYMVIATDVHPDVSEFHVTENNEFIVFARDSGPNGESGNYLVYKTIGEDSETYVYDASKINLMQNMNLEFILSGEDLIFSNNGSLQLFDLATATTEVTDLNNNSDHICNHFPVLFDIDNSGAQETYMTFINQVPGEIYGAVWVMPYSGSADDPVLGVSQGSEYTFGTYVNPVLLKDGDLIFLTNPVGTDTFWYYPSLSSIGSSTRITCSDTSTVNFNKAVVTPTGSRVFMYGYTSVYWFDNDGSISGGTFEVNGKFFTDTITNIITTPDDMYTVLTTGRGIWLYDNMMTQLEVDIDWLNRADEVLWVEVK